MQAAPTHQHRPNTTQQLEQQPLAAFGGRHREQGAAHAAPEGTLCNSIAEGRCSSAVGLCAGLMAADAGSRLTRTAHPALSTPPAQHLTIIGVPFLHILLPQPQALEVDVLLRACIPAQHEPRVWQKPAACGGGGGGSGLRPAPIGGAVTVQSTQRSLQPSPGAGRV